MKHLIIFNEKAGDSALKDILKKQIKEDFNGLDYETYNTEGPRKVIPFLRQYLLSNKDTVRVYACGGDGTVNEVVNGIVGFDNAELAILPIGTGNDFVKIYGIENDAINQYRSFKPLINGAPIEIDLSKIDGESLSEPWYSINVINFGFDAIVGAKGNINKQKGKKDPYGPAAIIPAILSGRFNKIVVKANGEQLNKKTLLLASLAQGQFVGGKFHASPKSDNTDGLIDVVVLKCMSLVMFISFFGIYEKGLLFDTPRLMKKVSYRRAENIEIIAPEDIDICVDGEMIRGKHFFVDVCPKAIKLVPPDKFRVSAQ